MPHKLSIEIMDYILKRPITHKLKLEAALKDGFGIRIPLLFGGPKEKVFKDLVNAIYFVSTEAMLLDASLALEKYFDEDNWFIADETLKIFDGLSSKALYVKEFHELISNEFIYVENPKELPTLALTTFLYGGIISELGKEIDILEAERYTPSPAFKKNIDEIVTGEIPRVFLDSIGRVFPGPERHRILEKEAPLTIDLMQARWTR